MRSVSCPRPTRSPSKLTWRPAPSAPASGRRSATSPRSWTSTCPTRRSWKRSPTLPAPTPTTWSSKVAFCPPYAGRSGRRPGTAYCGPSPRPPRWSWSRWPVRSRLAAPAHRSHRPRSCRSPARGQFTAPAWAGRPCKPPSPRHRPATPSQLLVNAAGLPRGAHCQLYVVTADGTRELAGSWTVPAGGPIQGSAAVNMSQVQAVAVKNADTGQELVYLQV